MARQLVCDACGGTGPEEASDWVTLDFKSIKTGSKFEAYDLCPDCLGVPSSKLIIPNGGKK